MVELPAGTVTFLFTDVEGSTKAWEAYPAQMRTALARHDAIAAEVIERHDGRLVKSRGEGDSLFAVFARATDGLAAACALELAFFAEPWPAETPIRVRMALHAGEADLRDGDYYGSAVNRCARLRATAYGGQVILSLPTEELVRDALPAGSSLRDLGHHRLRDLHRAEQVFQLVHPSLPGEFPPLKSLDSYPNNLTSQLTTFIGREKEMEEIKRLLLQSRLLTLCGTGGTGKTRTSLQVGADVLEDYPDGVWFVELAPLTDPALVPQTVATTLGVREQPGRSALQSVVEFLKPKALLVILDNCEHLVAAAAQTVDTILRACPGVRILASSREGLGIAGEQTYHVPSLSLPDPQRLPSLERLGQFEAVRLFIDRAVLSDPQFAVTNENAPAVAKICHRLDGVPLAIELAAARVRVMPPEQIAARLDDRFRLLTGGSRTALPHHKTLRALIDWSMDLLSETERMVLRRVSVFLGGFGPDAIPPVVGGDGIEDWEALDYVTALVDKSLIVYERQHEPARYRLLETIREYALVLLEESGEAPAARERHFDHFLALALRSEPHLARSDQGVWLAGLEREHDNLRAALDWSAASGERHEDALVLAGTLWRFWYVHGYRTEGRERLARALAAGSAAGRTAERAIALNGAGVLAWAQGDYPTARTFLDESLAIRRELDDRPGLASTLNNLGVVAQKEGAYEEARALHEESLAIRRALSDQTGTAHSLNNLGAIAHAQGDLATARALYDESLAIRRRTGDSGGIALLLTSLGGVARAQAKPDEARALFEQGVAIYRELGDKGGLALALANAGEAARDEGDLARARAQFEEALSLQREIDEKEGLALSLESFAGLAAAEGRAAPAVRLFGAAHAMREAIHAPLAPVARAEQERFLATSRATLGQAPFDAEWNAGAAMSLEDAIALALSRSGLTPLASR